jgi:hypothetical protein
MAFGMGRECESAAVLHFETALDDKDMLRVARKYSREI